jgi:hypothetical protein
MRSTEKAETHEPEKKKWTKRLGEKKGKNRTRYFTTNTVVLCTPNQTPPSTYLLMVTTTISPQSSGNKIPGQ